MRTKLQYSLINLADNIQLKGLFKVIQEFLFGNAKNVCPRGCKW